MNTLDFRPQIYAPCAPPPWPDFTLGMSDPQALSVANVLAASTREGGEEGGGKLSTLRADALGRARTIADRVAAQIAARPSAEARGLTTPVRPVAPATLSTSPEAAASGYLRARGCASLIAIGLSTWWAWVASGRAPAGTKVAGVRLWKRSDVEALAEGRL